MTVRPVARPARSVSVGVFLLACALCAVAQSAQPASGKPVPILSYIHGGWDTLSRSMSDCKSVADSKVKTGPTLYLPAGMAEPPSLSAMQRECAVHIKHLPRHIGHLGELNPADIPREGLLFLPNTYVVPGGRFNEMYGWDSYFILLGLVEDRRIGLARGIVENFFFEIENYGAVLNANRTYFLTRSQPPFLSSMVREVYEHLPTKTAAERQSAKEWLRTAYRYAGRDYQLWVSPPHLAGDTGLARYADLGNGPVPEMEDDSTYYSDVIRWLLAHPAAAADYLVAAPDSPSPTEASELARTSCDPRTSAVCARAFVDGHRLSSAFYHGDRAMRESGFDTSFRFGPFSGSTDQYAPVCLNSLLYKYERDMEHFAGVLGRPDDASMWKHRAEARNRAIHRYLWNADDGLFYDYNSATGKQSDYKFIATFYALWAGLATPAEAALVERHLATFEREGGMAMSDNDSGTQWDLPYGWAPTNWIAVQGLARYGFRQDALRLARKFTRTVDDNYARDGTIREKYNVVSGSSNIAVAAGYKANVVGFGWTNGVYLKMAGLLRTGKKTQAP